MNQQPATSPRIASPPRGIAVSGMLFSVLYIVSLTLIRLSAPADPADPGNWLADANVRNSVRTALNLVPFTGIAFLWFMAVLRNRIGEMEDRFFATVFLGSGLLFVAMLFTAAALTSGLLETFSTDAAAASETYRVGRRMAYVLINTFGMRMVAVFMFVTSTIGLRTRTLSRGVSIVGYVLGIILLLSMSDFAWIALLFPLWALLVSAYIFLTDVQREHPQLRDRSESQSSESAAPSTAP